MRNCIKGLESIRKRENHCTRVNPLADLTVLAPRVSLAPGWCPLTLSARRRGPLWFRLVAN